MLSASFNQIILDVIIVVYIFYKQLQPKEIKTDSKGQYVILIIGAINAWNKITHDQLKITISLLIGALISFVILAIGFAYLRTITCKIYEKNGHIYRQGNYKTLILWAIMIIIHAVVNKFIPELSSTFILYMGISFSTQYLITLWRYQNGK